ncbi:MAG: curli assembly protein CsgF [Burkholderiales bacterium]|nr:curli assembly protein CsgF [Burkholderiales bacterium]
MTGAMYCLTFALLMSAGGRAQATELIYVPVNPMFGGSPLNGSTLLSAAQAQNKSKDPNDASSRYFDKSPLEQFNDNLERAIISQLSSAAASRIVGPNGKFTPGSLETGNFLITVVDLGGGLLRITTTDKVSGSTTSFEVKQ